MNRPRLLDLFCGAGGAAMGYYRAGFDVVGVDVKPQPHYPFEFVQADAMTYPLEGFGAIHASPPCQDHSALRHAAGRLHGTGWMLAATRERLLAQSAPWVIENVPGAAMRTDYRLCGCMFDLPRLRRERWFETSWRGFDLRPPCHHVGAAVTVAGHGAQGSYEFDENGNYPTQADRRAAMGIDWMNRDELAQAIPPDFAEHIGRALMDALAVAQSAPQPAGPARRESTPGAEGMNVLSLFSGIGGLDLGLERAGMTVVGQVEIDPWCRKVLAKHWPEVPRHDDVRTAAAWWGGRAAPDLVAGGFPCQPVSYAGQRGAQDDPRWLWPAMAAVVRSLRPRYVLVENVIGLSTAGLGDVLGDLAALGFDAEWGVLSACALGAPHSRERLFIAAHTAGVRRNRDRALGGSTGTGEDEGRLLESPRGSHWTTEPGVGRVADGIPGRVDRLRGLGNAVVPQVAEHIGRIIMSAAAV